MEPSELYQCLLATRPPRQGAVEWNEGRNRTVNVPFKSYWAVTDTTDEIQTAEVRARVASQCACGFMDPIRPMDIHASFL